MKFFPIVISFLLVLIIGCNQNRPDTKDYPSVVIEKGLEGYYDQAKYVVYKINGGMVCNCKGEVAFNGSRKDTFNLLELDVEMLNLRVSPDTVILFLDFFYENKRAFILPQGYSDCFSTVGVIFLEGAKTPALVNVGHKAYIDLYDRNWDSIRTNNLLSCVSSGYRINPWLLNYIESNSIKPY